jgi:predicted short-subunit dehydrogenase-like oxidoreductase (DUF2520 family)
MAALLPRAGHEVRPWHRGEPVPASDVAWITVPDDAVAEVARLVRPGPVVLHASGVLEVDVLRPHRPAGSLHPLTTFPGPDVGLPDLRDVAAAVAGDPEAVATASALAVCLGLRPVAVPGDRRLYHAATVIAGNFAAVLLAEATALLRAAGVAASEAPGLLLPLARASLDHAAIPDPTATFTGPFARGDAETVAAHRQALAATAPHLLPAYDALGRLALTLAAGLLPERREAVLGVLATVPVPADPRRSEKPPTCP